MKTNRIISLLLSALLLCTLLPNVALASEVPEKEVTRAIMRGVSGISKWEADKGYDYIYFGKWNGNHVKWRVLDTKTNTGDAGLFLLSEDALGDGSTNGGVYFQMSIPYSNAWQGSDAQVWCQTFYTNQFTGGEQGAVLATTKKDAAYTSTTYSVPFAGSGDQNILDNDKVFFLSAEEAENSAYGFTDDDARKANYKDAAGVWWLRSPYANFYAGFVGFIGIVDDAHVFNGRAARPAFNLNLNSVLFTSAAAGGKSPAEGGTSVGEADGEIFKIPTLETAPKEWKVTLLDSSRNGFTVNETAVSGAPGSTISVTYSGAKANANNEYISAIIADPNGNYLYYGRVPISSASGTATFTLPTDVPIREYTLHVFNEQCNDDYETDYASQFVSISLTVEEKVDAQTPTISTDIATLHVSKAPVVPETGDSSRPGLYLAMLLAGGVGLSVLGKKRKRT